MAQELDLTAESRFKAEVRVKAGVTRGQPATKVKAKVHQKRAFPISDSAPVVHLRAAC